MPTINKNSTPVKPSSIIMVIVLVAMLGSMSYFLFAPVSAQVDSSDGLKLLQGQTVTQVTVEEATHKVKLDLNANFQKNGLDLGNSVSFYYITPQGVSLIDTIQKGTYSKGFNFIYPQDSLLASLGSILELTLPLLLIFGVFMLFMSWQQKKGGGGLNPFSMGKSRAKLNSKDAPKTKFSDVKGEDEAVAELEEIKDMLLNPDKYRKAGAKIPKGILLYGPPGTGKTLLARAVAGEANAPFFSASGSEFIEMIVGVGASRVRDLFDQAKKSTPAIIFIDEIDAIGKQRGSSGFGGHDEREQTLNQLLVEMDGFDTNVNVILIAATNRPDTLDKALLRPGRFDRQVQVDLPDSDGRKAILEVHSTDKKFAEGVDFKHIAKRTPGYSGADLENVLNEAALLAARRDSEVISMDDVDEAVDRVMAGPQKKNRVMSPEEFRNTAYHEAGHALVAASMNNTDPVTKVTILPRGRALGYTSVMPDRDKYSVTRNELLDQMAYAMGGRCAEEIVFHDPTTGASNDIEKATAIAESMVTLYGMSSKLGAVKLAQNDTDKATSFYGSNDLTHSEKIITTIDEEVRGLIENAHNEAYAVLNANRPVLDKLVEILLEKETILEEELATIFKDVKKLKPRNTWLSSNNRPVSDNAPVPVKDAKK